MCQICGSPLLNVNFELFTFLNQKKFKTSLKSQKFTWLLASVYISFDILKMSFNELFKILNVLLHLRKIYGYPNLHMFYQ